MKKVYLNPEMQVIKVSNGVLLSDSIAIGDDNKYADPSYEGGGEAKEFFDEDED